MRNRRFLVGALLVAIVAWIPNGIAVKHDDPCQVNLLGQTVAGDAPDTWQGANRLSGAGLGAGCTTESIAAVNTCGATADNSDWFFANHPENGPMKSIRVTVSFQFTFCGGPSIDADLEVYFVLFGAIIPAQFYTSADGNGPGVKLCESHNGGTVTETVTCNVGANGAFGALGRYYVHKTRVSGTGANLLRVNFV